MNGTDEFYVGYARHAPFHLRRFLMRVVLGLNAVAAAIALLLVFGQKPFAASTFEFQQYREFEGRIEELPYPSLLVTRPGDPSFSRYWLVRAGKHGASEAVAGLAGTKARIRGALIYRREGAMIELAPGAKPVLEGREGGVGDGAADLGAVTLTGEVADSKCYFGVMNPGNGKVDRDCAVRCISGGIPPVFLVREARGAAKAIVLVGGDGRQLNREVLDFVAEPITIAGHLTRAGETYILRAEPTAFARAAGGGRRP